MSASRPVVVATRVVEALPRLAADHVPHALAQRLARGLDLGGQFAYYQYESERPAEHPSCAYLRAYPYKYSYERQPRSIPQRMARALEHARFALALNVLWPMEQAALLSVAVIVALLVCCGLVYGLKMMAKLVLVTRALTPYH